MSAQAAALPRTREAHELARGFGVFGLFTGISLAGLLAYQLAPTSTPLLIAVLLLPYPTIFLAIVALRRMGILHFQIGRAGPLLRRYGWVAALLVLVAAIALYRAGEFGPHSFVHRLQKFLTYPVLDPLAEEFAFRGAILTSLNGTRLGAWRIGGLLGGTLVSALLFAAVHLLNVLGGQSLQASALQAAGALFPGLLFGWIYQRTGKLWFGVVLHSFANLVMP